MDAHSNFRRRAREVPTLTADLVALTTRLGAKWIQDRPLVQRLADLERVRTAWDRAYGVANRRTTRQEAA
jgi:hypothetical protein